MSFALPSDDASIRDEFRRIEAGDVGTDELTVEDYLKNDIELQVEGIMRHAVNLIERFDSEAIKIQKDLKSLL